MHWHLIFFSTEKQIRSDVYNTIIKEVTSRPFAIIYNIKVQRSRSTEVPPTTLAYNLAMPGQLTFAFLWIFVLFRAPVPAVANIDSDPGGCTVQDSRGRNFKLI